jgi:hypothetical protein
MRVFEVGRTEEELEEEEYAMSVLIGSATV